MGDNNGRANQIADELEAVMAALRANVAEISEILLAPEVPNGNPAAL